MEDGDFEEEINYRRICKDIIKNLNQIKSNLWFFDKFPLSDYQKKDLIKMKKKLGELNLSEYTHQTFINLMDTSCQIEDFLKEISLITTDLTKNINNLSKKDKEKICSYFKIEKITPKFKKLSLEFNSNLSKMLGLIKKIINKYLIYYKEE